jgi:hypothetical protein
MRVWIEGAVFAALSGAATTCSAVVIDPDHFGRAHLLHLGMVALAGAIPALIGYVRQQPAPQWDGRERRF